jgi:hypothetical protein
MIIRKFDKASLEQRISSVTRKTEGTTSLKTMDGGEARVIEY